MKELTSVYGAHIHVEESAVKKWVGRFRSGRESVGNDARTGPLATVCNTCNIEKVKREIEKDHQEMIRDVTDSTDFRV